MVRAASVACLVLVLIGVGGDPGGATGAREASSCTFSVAGTTMYLDADCWPDESIVVPDGFTLDGRGHTITALDPLGGFNGAVVRNGGDSAFVRHLTITVQGLVNLCKSGDDRLRGIMFDGASGEIEHTRVIALNKGASGCQEGNAIEVRNAPFDGTHPNTQTVSVAHNVIADYQKTGIVANGDVDVSIRNNDVGSSATQANLAANAIQIGFGARATVRNNKVGGNSWCGPSNFAATALLLFESGPGTVVSHNHAVGDSDVSLYVFGSNTIVESNNLSDGANTDCNQAGYDIGVGDYGAGNTVTKNKVWGFQTPYELVTGDKNKSKVRPKPASVQ